MVNVFGGKTKSRNLGMTILQVGQATCKARFTIKQDQIEVFTGKIQKS